MTNDLAIRILSGAILGTTEQTHEAVAMAIKALSALPSASDLIDRRAAIGSAMKDVSDKRTHDFNAGATRAANRIKLLPSAQPEQRWIPCSERLPQNERKTYWVCTDTGHQCECRWTNVNHFWTDLTTDWHWHIMDIPRYTEVVAWMPLPEPYKGGVKDEVD